MTSYNQVSDIIVAFSVLPAISIFWTIFLALKISDIILWAWAIAFTLILLFVGLKTLVKIKRGIEDEAKSSLF